MRFFHVRLHDIVQRAEEERLADVAVVAVGAQHDRDGTLRQGRVLQRLQQLDPAEPGHLNIGEQQVDVAALSQLGQRLAAVGRFADDADAESVPVDQPMHGQANERFIVDNHHVDHGGSSSGAIVGWDQPFTAPSISPLKIKR
ncbi:hypothetical protein ABE452_16770 [Paenibacillus ferrarius]